MSPQEIQLLTDAVKIGFPVIGTIAGALIGVVATYTLTKLSHRHDNQKELGKRRFELLMQTANDITEFEHLIGTYVTEVNNKIHGFKSAGNYDEARTNILTKNQALRRARMNLKILGLKEAEENLEKYVVLSREVTRLNTHLTKERVSELAKVIVIGPVDFYVSIAKEISLKT